MLTLRGGIHVTTFVLALSLCVRGLQPEARAADKEIFNDGELVVWGREAPAGVVEPAIPTYHNGALQGDFKVLEASDKVPGVGSWPLTMVDLVANTYVRTTYQMANGTTATLGTSVVGTTSYRTAADFHYVPTVSQAQAFTGGADRLRTIVTGQFGTDASTVSTRTFPDPPIGSTTTGLTIGFEALQDIHLNAGLLGNDAFRFGGMASMFASTSQYDANLLRWKDPNGGVHTLQLSDATPRDSHLFASPMEISVGGYFELLKEEGSTWSPTSPCIRMDLLSLSGLTGRIGVQGWLAATTDPNDDSLSVWLEWIDAPATIPSGAAYEAAYSVTASPPVPEPAALSLLTIGGLALVRRKYR